jgi:hypothetical protein
MISILSMTLLMEVLSHEISRVLRNMDIWGIGEIPLIPRPLLPGLGEGGLEHKSDLTTALPDFPW